MEPRSLKFIAEACAADVRRGSVKTLVENVCTDSRQAKPGDLFFAIKGEKFDGHDFLTEVVAKGVTAVVVPEKGKIPAQLPDCAVLVVKDTRAALGRLAAAYRKEFDLPVVCVGGSNGKTTVKELIASVLQPKYGVITNIGREHLEFFGDVAGVAQEEGRLAELLPVDGRLFVNGDNDWTEEIVRRTRAGVVRAGLGERNDWRAKGIRPDKNGVTFSVDAPKIEWNGEFRINLLGRHQVINALLAMAVSEELGLGRSAVRDGLAGCRPAKMRLQFWEAGGVRVLDDTYNANADSALVALETLCDLPLQGRRVAVLGDMNELGAHSEAAHAEVGRRAAELGIGQLFAVGKMAPVTARAARDAGLNRVIEFADVETAMAAVKSFLKTGDVVLLKASRLSRLERIAETLKSGKA